MPEETTPTRRDVLRLAGAAAVVGALPELADAAPAQKGKSVAGLIAPKMDRVRVGFVGVGARGSGHVESMLAIEGVDVTAICDTDRAAAERSAKTVTDTGRPTPVALTGPEDYRRLAERADVDIVLISTPWSLHVPMALAALAGGKHAFVEVPAATTVEDCWKLVDAAEKSQRHLMMLENVNYGREELMVLNMVRQGVFGELLHAEAAYIHDLRWQMKEIERGTGSWRTYEYTKRNGNLYPTHGLGPVAQYLDVNRGDRLDFLCSVSSPARARELYAREQFPEGHERRSLKFKQGDINTTIVKTVLGKTIMIQWDEQLPRPYTRHNLVQGTRGVWAGFPNRLALESHGGIEGTPSSDQWVQGKELEPWYQQYDHPLWKRLGEEAKANGGHGGMDFVMLWRVIYCLRNGLPMDQDAYDAATWSVIGPLSEASVAKRGRSTDIPDFTRGTWKTMRPLGIAA